MATEIRGKKCTCNAVTFDSTCCGLSEQEHEVLCLARKIFAAAYRILEGGGMEFASFTVSMCERLAEEMVEENRFHKEAVWTTR